MEITLERKENNEASIKVQLKEADYASSVENKLKEYAKTAKMNGFRPGKVPHSLVKKMYGKSVLFEEVQNVAFTGIYKYLEDNKLSIFGRPLPDVAAFTGINWEGQKDFDFVYNVGLQPELTAVDYSAVKVDRYEIELTDEAYNETLTDLRTRFGKQTEAETATAHDTLNGLLKESNGDKEFKISLSLDKVTDKVLPKMIGATKGTTIAFEINDLLKDLHELMHLTGLSHDDVHHLHGNFEFIVDGILHREPAEINEEFYERVFGKDVVKTEEEFTAKLKETILENYKRETDFLYKLQLDEFLIGNTPMALPKSFLKNWIITSNEGKYTAEQVDKDWDRFEKGLKQDMVYAKIAKDNNLNVTEEEVQNAAKNTIRSMFYNYGLYDISDEMLETQAKMYLENKEQDNRSRIVQQVMETKVFETLKEKVKSNTKKVTHKEFIEIANKH